MRGIVKSPVYVILFAAVTSAVFTAAIASLHIVTAKTLARSKLLIRERALVELFDLGDLNTISDDQTAQLVARQIDQTMTLTDPDSGRVFQLIRAYDRSSSEGDARLIGYAFDVSGNGFWARIDGLVAVTPDLVRIKGVVFLKHSETPGLGGRITESQWRKKFKGLQITPPQPGAKYIYIGGEGPVNTADPKYARHVDAVTGATQTSAAISEFLNRNFEQFHRAAAAAGVGKGD